MTNKKISIAITLAMVVIIAFSAISCNKVTPYKLWSNAVQDIKNAGSVSADIEITYGTDSYSISAKHDIANSSRAVEIKFSEDDIMKIYSDGKTNYYENGGIKYSSDNAEDNPVVKEFLSFSLRDAKTLSFTKDFFSGAEFKKEDKTTIKVVANGNDIKNAIAPDEDLEFSEKITLSAEFDPKTSDLMSVMIEGEVGGKEFFGLPLCKSVNASEKTAFTAKITNISYSKNALTILPENTSEYPNLPALAQMNASVRLMALKKDMRSEINGTMEMSLMGMNIKLPLSGSITVADNEGFTTTRTKMKLEMNMMGMDQSQNIDTFTDGKSDYVYYTADDSEDCYKMIPEKDTNSGSMTEMTDLFKDPKALQKYFEGAEISKSGKDTIISVDLNTEQMNELIKAMNSDEASDSLGLGDLFGNIEMSDCSMKIKITVNANGIMTKNSFDLSIVADAQSDEDSILPVSNMKISLSAEVKYSDIYEKITPDIPQGYENYPERNPEIDF